MTVLVTGASGFLGSRVVQQLCASGLPHIRCFIRPNSDISALERLRDQYPATDVEYVVGNLLCLSDAIRATRRVDAVFHLAAQAIVGDANASPVPTFETNVQGTWVVLEACREAGVEIVVSMSMLTGTHAMNIEEFLTKHRAAFV